MKKLRLNRETLRALTTASLVRLAGGLATYEPECAFTRYGPDACGDVQDPTTAVLPPTALSCYCPTGPHTACC